MLFDTTHNGHIKWYMDDQLFQPRTNEYQNYKVEFGSVDKEYYQKNNFENECKRICDLQYSLFKDDMVLYLSGGLDSEIVARCYVDIGLKPNLVSLRFINKKMNEILNAEEVDEATRLADVLGLTLNYIDIDIYDFYLSGESTEMAKQLHCHKFPILIFYKAVSIIKNPSILCCDLLIESYKNNQNQSEYRIRYEEFTEAATQKFINQYNIPTILEWYAYTPEIMLYYMESPIIKNFIETKQFKTVTNVKNTALKTLISYANTSTKKKTWGHEKTTGLLIENIWNLTHVMPYRMNINVPSLNYNNVIKSLRGE